MNKEQQDKLWSCLTSTQRIICRGMHKTSGDGNVEFILDELFGHHNLTSDTEPEEMLMVSKSKVVERIRYLYSHPAHIAAHKADERASELRSLFGDTCLRDKEPIVSNDETKGDTIDELPKLKFKVGDKVRVIEEGIYKGFITEVIGIDESDDDCPYQIDSYRAFEEGRWFSDSDLEPYTETEKEVKETQNLSLSDKQKVDNMEEKELNLCELLKSCEGEWLYVVPCGEMELKGITKIELKPLHFSRDTINCLTKADGRAYEDGSCIIYPSRALYEKYPLDAPQAWREWAESSKPKYVLQAQLRLISNNGKTIEDYECVEVNTLDNDLTKAAEVVREALEKFHSNHTEQ